MISTITPEKIEQSLDDLILKWQDNYYTDKEAYIISQYIIGKSFKLGILNRKDKKSLTYRRDNRTAIGFFRWLKEAQKREDALFNDFVSYLKNNGKNVSYKPYGSDVEGRVILHNYAGSYTWRPDYVLLLDGEKSILIESKSFKYDQYFKVENLKTYVNSNAFMVVGWNKYMIIYQTYTIKYMLEVGKKVSHFKSEKECIKVGGYDGISLKDIEEKGKGKVVNSDNLNWINIPVFDDSKRMKNYKDKNNKNKYFPIDKERKNKIDKQVFGE